MTWKEPQEQAARVNNFPANITAHEIETYRRYQAEVWFNEYHGINPGVTESLKDAKHRIIYDCMMRGD